MEINRRIQFKIALITYKTLSTDQPPYLRNLLNPYRPSRSLRSANRNLLLIPPHNTNFSRRAFSFAAPTFWNKLPTGIRDSNTLHTFKHCLKTFFTSHPSKPTSTPSPAQRLPAPQIRRSILDFVRVTNYCIVLYCIVSVVVGISVV